MASRNVGIGLRNWWDGGTLSGGSWTLPLSNSQSTDRSLIARCASTSAANAVADCDFGASKSVRVVVVAGHNMGEADTWRVRLGTSSGASDVADSSGQAAWAMTFDIPPLMWEAPTWWGPTVTDTGHPYCSWIFFPQAYSARYMRLTFSTSAAVQFARVWAGDIWQPTWNVQQGLEHGWIDPSETFRAVGGALLASKRRRYRTARMTYPALTDNDAAVSQEVFRHAGTVEEVLYVPRPGDYSHCQRYGFIGRFRQLSPVQAFAYGYHTVGADFEEWI